MAPSTVRSLEIFSSKNPIAEATAAASTISELISTVPQTWRPALAPLLQDTYRVASKLCTVQNTVAQYERHVAAGSFPPFVTNSVKEPKVQFSKEFLGTESGRSSKNAVELTAETARKTLLSSALTQKKEELLVLQGFLVFDAPSWLQALGQASVRIGGTIGCKVEWSHESGTITWTGSTAPAKAYRDETKGLIDGGSTFHFRAIAIARSLADRQLVEKTKLLTIKSKTDVEMRDANIERTTLDVVDDRLDQRMAKFEQKIAGMLGNARKPAPKRKQKGGRTPPKSKGGVAKKKKSPPQKKGRK